MKKKTEKKKLVLAKETVVRLQDNLEQVAGGATLRCETYTCWCTQGYELC